MPKTGNIPLLVEADEAEYCDSGVPSTGCEFRKCGMR
jgi:hypothetical protein